MAAEREMSAVLEETKTSAAKLNLHPLNGTFGARVEGIRLAEPLDQEQIDAIRTALYDYRVLVFRGQADVAPAQLLQFAANFGSPEVAPHPQHPDHEDAMGVKVLVSNAKDVSDPVLDSWHTDGATRTDTRYVSVLQAIDVPEFGRDTMFADMVTAYNRLSEPMKALIDQLIGVNSWGAQKPGAPNVEHPVVFRDRETGRKSLYANKLYTIGIKGMRRDESEAILNFLLAQARVPEFQARVSWEPGTIVMWDNETTQHYLVFDRAYRRVMHRVMVN